LIVLLVSPLVGHLLTSRTIQPLAEMIRTTARLHPGEFGERLGRDDRSPCAVPRGRCRTGGSSSGGGGLSLSHAHPSRVPTGNESQPQGRSSVNITQVKVFPVAEEKLKAYVSIVIDECFLVSDLKVIHGPNGLFISMPSKRKKNGEFKDIAHPLNRETRERMEKRILEEYEKVKVSPAPGPSPSADEIQPVPVPVSAGGAPSESHE